MEGKITTEKGRGNDRKRREIEGRGKLREVCITDNQQKNTNTYRVAVLLKETLMEEEIDCSKYKKTVNCYTENISLIYSLKLNV